MFRHSHNTTPLAHLEASWVVTCHLSQHHVVVAVELGPHEVVPAAGGGDDAKGKLVVILGVHVLVDAEAAVALGYAELQCVRAG